ncbi:hypothetical protein [Diplocloster modestus]|uniref:Uncharacterized protein n=1 Tax=Diplocloster modestus TaxID=2850322 RepID=A0ABS6K133_9FIRM|nr:hypothetical protein [Diplocloster modestus]MBU9724566.1 hypothetical protein [Diplocloster modestus]
MIKKVCNWIDRNIRRLLLLGILLSVLGIIASYLFPNEYMATQGYNTKAEQLVQNPLAEGTVMEYKFQVDERLLGVQVKYTTYDKKLTSGVIHYEVLSQTDGHSLGSSAMAAPNIAEGQDVLMPFTGFETCSGPLILRIWCDGVTDGNYPGIYTNPQIIPDVSTSINGQVLQGNMIMTYCYPAYNKPLLWYFVLFLFVLLTLFAVTDKGQPIIRKGKKKA